MRPGEAERNPVVVFLVSVFYSFVAMFFAHMLFSPQSSVLSIAFITILFVPFFQLLFRVEEAKVSIKTNNSFISRHRKAFGVYAAFFVGVVLVYVLVFSVLPTANVFDLQVEHLREKGHVAGKVTSSSERFFTFFYNNTRVMLLSFVLSALFGTGAVFILSWNASIIGVYFGLLVRKYFSSVGMVPAYFHGVTEGLMRIGLHGVPEIFAYIMAGFAGGIFSIIIIREKYGTKRFKVCMLDALALLSVAELLIFIAAVLEAVA